VPMLSASNNSRRITAPKIAGIVSAIEEEGYSRALGDRRADLEAARVGLILWNLTVRLHPRLTEKIRQPNPGRRRISPPSFRLPLPGTHDDGQHGAVGCGLHFAADIDFIRH
jgi:hypothetical protein